MVADDAAVAGELVAMGGPAKSPAGRERRWEGWEAMSASLGVESWLPAVKNDWLWA